MSYNNSVSPIWLRQVATALSSRYNVQIREGKGWAMDIENRVMTYKAEHLLALDRDTCLGILLHELGHLHFTTSEWMETSKLFKKYDKIVFNAVNAYEDVRINEKMSQSYMGSRDLIEAMNELLAGDGVQQIMKMDKEIRERNRSRGDYDMAEWFEVFYISMTKLLGDTLFPQIAPDMYYDSRKLEVINEIVREAEAQNLAQFETTGDIYQFVERIVFPKIEQYLPEIAPDRGKGDSKKGQGKPEEDENGGQEGNEGSEQEVTDDSNEDTGKGKEQGEEGTDEAKPEKKEESKPDEASARGGNSGVGGDTWKKELEDKVKKAIKRGRVNPDVQHRTEPFDKYGEAKRSPHIAQSCNVDKHIEQSQTLQRQFKNKFEAVFRDNQYAREQANQRSGRINKRALYKARLGKTRLFKRKIEISKKSYAVGFALDLSGSMSPSQVQGSFHAMLAFTNTLDKLAIPHGVAFFSHESEIGKPFDKKMVTRAMSLKASSVNNGGTNPNKIIQHFFGKDLMEQKVKEHIAIILTDGMWRWDAYQELEALKKNNPKLHIYVVPLMLHPHYHKELADSISEKTATILHADSPEDIMDKYLQIARKHLI